ncbi:hypothetical protein PUN28_016725 [Cardiocondyla obscurior]|uniref:Uncharacterized protein n=1 Tax=Cardiocondyla obscurior TaxID=286306 RepID=A0AAW2EQU1_9HYME
MEGGRRGTGTNGMDDGLRDARAGARRMRAASEKENALSRSRRASGAGGERGRAAERGWIKASTRGGNKERTKKVEEVGGGGWVPWSALIGSTWSDEKFNHPPIPTIPDSLRHPPALLCLPLSFSFSLRTGIARSPPRRLNSRQMNLPHIYVRRRCLQVSADHGEETKLNRPVSTARLRKHPAIDSVPDSSAPIH